MVFSSLEFLFLFLPAALLLIYAIPARFLPARNLALLIVSLLFYAWGEPLYVLLMLGTVLFVFYCGALVGKTRESEPRKAKIALMVCAAVNLAVLGFFKYGDFFISNLNRIPGLPDLPLLQLALPVGISFYTFQALSYVADVYRGRARVQKNAVSFGAYVTMFPQLIAGPIVRYQDIDSQLEKRSGSGALFASGVRTLIAGLCKKVLLANNAGELWAAFRAVPVEERTVLGCWVGLVCYGFQIYFDFSAYSDMAIGLGKMLAFRFMENFNYPYIAQSVTEFWRRWHISLSSWFREYVYIPLGGSRRGRLLTYRNLLIVWLLTGFWHGAAWNFVLWGLYYFVLLVIEKTFLLKLLQKLPGALAAVAGRVYTLFCVLIGWLIFVFDEAGVGFSYLGNLFGAEVSGFTSRGDVYDLGRNLLFFAILTLAATPLPKRLFYRFYARSSAFVYAACLCGVALFLLCVAYLADSSFNPFLYFRF